MRQPRLSAIVALTCTLSVAAFAQQVPSEPAKQSGLPAADGKAAEKEKRKLPATEQEKQIDAAIAKLRELKSLTAEIEINARMLGQLVKLTGDYAQAPNHRMRLALKLAQFGDATGTMLQVCDGSVRWDFTQIIDQQLCSKLDFAKILAAIDKPECDQELRTQILSGLGFAGPESMLVGLRESIRFDQQLPSQEIEGVKVLVFRGRWSDVTKLVAPGQGAIREGAALPPYVPSIVTVFIGEENGWPYRVEMEGKIPVGLDRRDERMLDPTGRPIGRKSSTPKADPSKLTIVYKNVVLNPTLDDRMFAFSPPNTLQVRDDTEDVAVRLEQAITARAAAKRNEAAAKAGGLLEQPVIAPSPKDDAEPKPATPK